MASSRAEVDGLLPARGLIIGVRWGALAVAASVGTTVRLGEVNLIAAAVLAAVAAARTVRPVRLRPRSLRDLTLLAGETGLTLAAIIATGGWSSPYLFCLTVAAIAVGYAFDLIISLSVGLGLVLVITGLGQITGTPALIHEAVLGSSQVVLLFALAGYARSIFRVEEERVSLALDRVQRLTEANDLLFELHRVAQTLPVSLELGDTLTLTGNRIRELFHADVYAVLLKDDATGQWQVAAAEGIRTKVVLAEVDLPLPARHALSMDRPLLESALADTDALVPGCHSGLYCALRARDTTLGVIVIEHRTSGAFTDVDIHLLEGIGEQAALAIDNARMFQRLRTVGAHEERSRIARDLHDRVGQSLAFLAFELDRLAGRATGTALSGDLHSLRNEVRRAVTEVRETLYDLRSDVTEKTGLAEVVGQLAARVESRSGIRVTVDAQGDVRPPLTLERELLRIAQEAMANVERHAGATAMTVAIRLQPDEASLSIIDDGTGFVEGEGARIDSYGLLGMRERATAIGASLDIIPVLGQGTTVRCRVQQPDQEGSKA